MIDCDGQILPGDWQHGGRAGRAGTTPGSGWQLLSNHQQGNFAFYAFFSGRFAICISDPYFLKYLFCDDFANQVFENVSKFLITKIERSFQERMMHDWEWRRGEEKTQGEFGQERGGAVLI